MNLGGLAQGWAEMEEMRRARARCSNQYPNKAKRN